MSTSCRRTRQRLCVPLHIFAGTSPIYLLDASGNPRLLRDCQTRYCRSSHDLVDAASYSVAAEWTIATAGTSYPSPSAAR
eukprot:scaffold11970_cov112-Isochrysis_galbana.AAC.4